MPSIALDDIDPPVISTRQLRPSIEDDAELQNSIAAIGVVQPILVASTGNRYAVVAGERRWRLARAAGLTEIPCEIFARADEGSLAAAAAAENMVRLPIGDVDQWRAVVRLQAKGYALAAAAECLGLPERRARQLDKLGRLHPDLLALIEEENDELPWHYLPAIANAPPEMQAKAAKTKGAVHRSNGEVDVAWHQIAGACKQSGKRMSRSAAIFDVESSGIAWDEDIFAEPGTPDQFTTAEVGKFLKAQLEALKLQVGERAKKKQRLQIVDYDPNDGMKLPAGWSRIYGDPDKPKREETVFACIDTNGSVQFRNAVNVKMQKAKEKERQKKLKAKDSPASADAGEDAGSDSTEAGRAQAADPEPAASGFTKSGMTILAKLRTQALKTRLRDEGFRRDASATQLIAMLTLALHARNVSIDGYNSGVIKRRDWYGRSGEDLLAALVRPDGHLIDDGQMELAAEMACETLARALSISEPGAETRSYNSGSGPVAEWIGQAIGADNAIGRCDTPELLATAGSAALKPLAQRLGVKLSKMSELRERLAGKAPDWRPDAAQFGAPGPVLQVAARDDGDDAEGDGDDE